MGHSLLLAFTNPASAEQEDAYNDWYTNVHVPDLLEIPGIGAARRYRLSDLELTPGAPVSENKYLAVYEIEGDVDSARAEISKRTRSGEMKISDALATGGTIAQVWMEIDD